jgi:hypothetical protein
MISYETVTTEWFDKDAIRLPYYGVGRVSYGDQGRSYIKLIDGSIEEPFRLYTSLTTAINTCAPTEWGLLEWWCRLGISEARRQLKVSQHYGTLMHIMAGKLLKAQHLDLDTMESEVEAYTSHHNYWEPECKDWADTLRYDMLAFAQWVQDFNVKPVGIEYVLLSDYYGFGTLIDLVCTMDDHQKGYWGEVYLSGPNKGQPKETKRTNRITAIVNLKSGRKGFYRNHGIQMVAERALWEENFPDIMIDKAMNWAPSDWEITPSYKVKEWSDQITIEEVDHIMGLAAIRFGNKAENKEYRNISGVLSMGLDPINYVSVIDVETYCRSKFNRLPF